tara:strand:+ start:59 stop:472 length:414 start_codon:yes stop_codon:yes gene_type:complete
MKILIMGLPGSGKTTIAKLISEKLNAVWINADEVRKKANDWDFSEEGRKRQALRMWTFAEEALDAGNIVVADFICPTEETRKQFNADYTVWMDTIEKGRFEDTNQIFEKPINPNFIIRYLDADMWAKVIVKEIKEHI